MLPHEAQGCHVDGDEVADALEARRREEGSLLREEGDVLGLGTVDIGRGEDHELGDRVLADVVEKTLGADDVEAVVLQGPRARVVEDAHVVDGGDLVRTEDRLGAVPAEIQAEVLDVSREIRARAAVDADDTVVPVELASQLLAEAAGDPGDDDHGAVVVPGHGLTRRRGGAGPGHGGACPGWCS